VNELVLEVDDLRAAERFYAGVLGLPVVERWPDREAIWLMAGRRTRIGLWRPQVGVAGGRGGAHVHFALHIPPRKFDAAVRRLRAFGLDPQVESHGRMRPSRSAYADDPDGNCVELWTRNVARYRRRGGGFPPSEHEASSAAHFDLTAADWDANYDDASMRGHRWQARQRAALDLLGHGPGTLLEVGFGSGRMIPPLEESGWTVHGVDPAAAMLQRARDRAPEAAERLILGRAEALPFEDETFDVVVAVGALEYTEIDVSVPELARVLRPGGRAVLVLRNGRAPTVAWQREVAHRLARMLKAHAKVGRAVPKRRRPPMSPARTRDLLSEAGLEIRSWRNVACEVIPDPLDRFAPRLAHNAADAAERSAAARRLFGTQRLILAVKEPAAPPGSPVR
jgi:ubiquinone/menaquinone biosynthesis C-methylase UbiE/catechol 2,3-dioxygenase-like lactoylglutathione lyase family enzyme